ncbi:cobalamin biosynthesis protein CobW [Afifella sp. H1R]|uniref:cobalamin biosynthesis protein CobW n=1 Tax=Afifella sp. H1R TaxID=2908841 RepID=UPI001F41D7A7|nr:cobalamin biosynthesis protein CobW [Afifella sp. H1R]MCF1503058.1 cobalamin biosynthesis protein CobW [Afifella sp. H1R]
MTNASERIPATIITGFLGAGKTTIIRHILENANGRKIALIVNEFGDMGFDGGLLSDCGSPACGEEDIVELSNGCICCTVADDFLPAMEGLLARGQAPDHIVIETSGLALPQPLVKAFAWPAVRDRVTVDGVVTVVDAEAVAAGRMASDEAKLVAQREADQSLDHDDPIEELFEDQLRCADLIILSKSDLVDEAGMLRVEKRVGDDKRVAASLIRATHGIVPPEVLLGVGAGAEDDSETRLSHHEMEGEEHEHDDFDSFSIAVTAPDKAEAEARITKALAMPGVLRIKGRLAIDGKKVPLVVQAVGQRLESWFDRGNGESSGEPKLVVIGLSDVDRAAVTEALGG